METLTKRTHTNKDVYDKINKIRNQYGEMQLRMGISYLFEIGCEEASRITDDDLEDTLAALLEKEEAARKQGKYPIMTPQFQCEIMKIGRDLAQISVWELLKYVQNYIFIGL